VGGVTGGVGVVHDKATSTQLFFEDHDKDIACIALSHDGTPMMMIIMVMMIMMIMMIIIMIMTSVLIITLLRRRLQPPPLCDPQHPPHPFPPLIQARSWRRARASRVVA
jgi:hypothetical protein